VKKPLSDENALVNLYRDITRENESQARSVFMFVERDNENPKPGTQTNAPKVHQLIHTFIRIRSPMGSIKAKQVL